ncbi:hypothetical protein ABH975_006235 [Bradyrhizobium ottawaense]
MSSQFTPHMWPSGSSKLRPYMKLYSSFGLGSATPPAASALPTIASTSLRVSRGQAEQRLIRGPGICDRLRRELAEFVVGRQHHVDGLGKDHAARRVVAELRVPGRADRLIEGGRTFEVGHGKIEENHPGHRKLLGRVLPKDGSPGGHPTRFPNIFSPPETIAPPTAGRSYFFSFGSRWMGSTHSTVSGFSTGSMSRLIATASPSLRTSTHSSTSSGLALISWCGT